MRLFYLKTTIQRNNTTGKTQIDMVGTVVDSFVSLTTIKKKKKKNLNLEGSVIVFINIEKIKIQKFIYNKNILKF